jgi:hypothetical protein
MHSIEEYVLQFEYRNIAKISKINILELFLMFHDASFMMHYTMILICYILEIR